MTTYRHSYTYTVPRLKTSLHAPYGKILGQFQVTRSPSPRSYTQSSNHS